MSAVKIQIVQQQRAGIQLNEFTRQFRKSLTTPFEFLKFFLTQEITFDICIATNQFASSLITVGKYPSYSNQDGQWSPVDEEELWRFLSIIIFMSIYELHSLDGYWRSDSIYQGVPIRNIMTKTRFKAILCFIQVVPPVELDNEQEADDYLLVAAIDFGTTFSGYAFSFRHEYERNPLSASSFSWASGYGGLMSLKTSTCILFNPDGEFESFGFEAEEQYSELALEKHHYGWSLFRQFKMKLYESQGLRRTLILEDDQGKPMEAMKVISSSILYLKNHLLEECKNQQTSITESDIKWVLTVPAIWDDAAKQFMREAAEKAGIKGNRLCLALEPEAASMFCMHLPVDKMVGSERGHFEIFRPGSKYLVLDAGGGTIDITVHEVQQNRSLKELHMANGGNWGGTKVDDAFRSVLRSIVGNDVMDIFSKEEKVDMLDLFRDFEVKKRTITPDVSKKMTFKFPISLSNSFKAVNSGKEIKDIISSKRQFASKLSWIGDKMRMDADIAKGLFEESVSRIVQHLKKLFKSKDLKDVDAILMVGGYSESQILCNAVRNNFKFARVIVPNEAGLAVLKGAVIYGHNSSIIKTRVCKYTYGCGCSLLFEEKVHKPSKKYIDATGEVRCADIFGKHVTCGESYTVGEPQAKKMYGISNPQDREVNFPVYMATTSSPLYTDDPSCQKLGKITIDVSETVGDPDRKVIIQMTFSGTEIEVVGKEAKTGRQVKAYFNFLG